MADQELNVPMQESSPVFAEKVGMRILNISDEDRRKMQGYWAKAPKTVWAEFSKRYGQMLRLLYTDIHKWDVIALLDHWQPAFRVFTFKNMDLTPTLEEYAQILGWPISQKEPIYTKTQIEVSYGHLANLLHLPLSQKPGGLHSSPLIKHLKKCCAEKRWGPFMVTTAILIYGLMIFPSRPQQIDEGALSIFLEAEKKPINPVPAILAETFMQLSTCRANYGYSFRASAIMLHIWMRLHLYPHKREICSLPEPPAFAEEIHEMLRAELTPEQRKTTYMNLRSYDIRWKILVGKDTSFIQSSGNLMCVPLIGIRGFTAYSPCLVMRQFGCKQPLPLLIDMDQYTRQYTKRENPDVNRKVKEAWRNNEVYTVSPPVSDEVDPDYPTWFQERTEAIQRGRMPTMEPSARSRWQLIDLERQITALKGVITSKDSTINDIRRQLEARTDQTKKIEKLERENFCLERMLEKEKRQHQLMQEELQFQTEDLQARLKRRPKGVGAEMTQLESEVWDTQQKIRGLEQQNAIYKSERQTFLDIEIEMKEEIRSLKEQLKIARQRGALAGTASKSRKIG